MSWQDEIDELKHREELAQGMGGEERIQRQHDNGPVSYTHLTLPTILLV